jgi:hypothetical protein
LAEGERRKVSPIFKLPGCRPVYENSMLSAAFIVTLGLLVQKQGSKNEPVKVNSTSLIMREA